MRIQSSYVNMKAASYSKEQLEIKQTRVKEEQVQTGLQLSHELPILDLFGVELEEKRTQQAPEVQGTKIYEISEEDLQKVRLLEKILSFLRGEEVRFILPSRLEVRAKDGSVAPLKGEGQEVGRPYMRRSVSYSREQEMKFQATGSVQTADGRAIDFDLKISRSDAFNFRSETVVDRKGKVVDPLVIHYDGNLPNLTQNKYSFDLDFDGAADQVSFLSRGSGFLAFDKNGDGKINDGRELFGPQSGNGFKDLAVYDEDSNGWIDEGDGIFNKLRIWNKDEEGRDVLFALGEVGVGAIYLGHVATDYALGNSPLKEDGYIRSTGIFLRENGTAGSVQHIDLAL